MTHNGRRLVRIGIAFAFAGVFFAAGVSRPVLGILFGLVALIGFIVIAADELAAESLCWSCGRRVPLRRGVCATCRADLPVR